MLDLCSTQVILMVLVTLLIFAFFNNCSVIRHEFSFCFGTPPLAGESWKWEGILHHYSWGKLEVGGYAPPLAGESWKWVVYTRACCRKKKEARSSFRSDQERRLFGVASFGV